MSDSVAMLTGVDDLQRVRVAVSAEQRVQWPGEAWMGVFSKDSEKNFKVALLMLDLPQGSWPNPRVLH